MGNQEKQISGSIISHPYDNSSNCSSAFRNTAEEDLILAYKQIILGYVVPSICLYGIISNILNIVVLSSNKLKDSLYTYLLGLAIADLLSLVLFLFSSLTRGLYNGDFGWMTFEVYIYFPFASASTMASALQTIAVTIERFFWVSKPMKSKQFCTRELAVKVTLGIYITCIIFNIPRCFAFTLAKQVSCNSTESADFYHFSYTEFGTSSFYMAHSWVSLIGITFGGILFLLIFNILLFRAVYISNKTSITMVSSSQQQRTKHQQRLTMTLVSVVTVFLIGELPSAMVNRSVSVAIYGQGDMSVLSNQTYQLMSLLGTTLVVLQHSLNFVIYCVLNRRFRTVFRVHTLRCSTNTVNDVGTTLNNLS
ncbi:probable G-protein coupled receptor B0563.6 [Lingula anatina]|uniref:Probable G-protein coupled receptor B0563.6 n=1 Tax=Lingula anatina TaxID=7574 RepID=A0A1S3H857_LINAN|nr:probable G-protein coupled receptor B0563.6 [Lingula anatina]|eukprot:XP_013381671.1 probable G-protein coupled receptor B0563.6 [Lingula anatina]